MKFLYLFVSFITLSSFGNGINYVKVKTPPPQPLGIHVTGCRYDIHGVDVEFETDLNPPYVVAIFRADEVGLGRVYPIRYKITNIPAASIGGNFSQRGNVFLQVFDSSILRTQNFRELTESERDSYFDSIWDNFDRSRPIVDYKDTWEVGSGHLRVVSDWTWVGFVKSDSPTITFKAAGKSHRRRLYETNVWQTAVIERGGFYSNLVSHAISSNVKYVTTNFYYKAGWHDCITNCEQTSAFRQDKQDVWWNFYNVTPLCDESERVRVVTTNTYNFGDNSYNSEEFVSEDMTFGPFDTSVGCGYRITFHEDRDNNGEGIFGEEMYDVVRAYSASTNSSEEILLKRPFISLSSHNGFRTALDWRGGLGYAVDTNSVNGRIHWNGL